MKTIRLKNKDQNGSPFIDIPEKKLLTSDRDRFFNCIIDFVFILITIFIITLFVIITGNIFRWDIYRRWEETLAHLGFVGTYLSFAIIYYFIFESLSGRTLGKIMTGSIIINEFGVKPGVAVIFKRTLCRFIPFEALSFLGESGRMWHDSLSNTYVVEKNVLEDEMKLQELNLIGSEEVI
ncbi:RDD family protein [Flavobacterium sp. LC2016-23]|uniref:RDD family protein n=1 Tax=Flavobacterium sp. LC2016-23 TaxID=2666330 RepID=UPI0012AFBC1A|nr:RDD family protein [Flavobacterium sp. LC2016-23]MRX37799.1 RDD family protein [Flavobacterium sp. LC2016-23]